MSTNADLLEVHETTAVWGRLESLQETQRAVLNILEDFDEERQKFELIKKATLNLLEDMHEERNKLAEMQRAVMNMLEDIEGERVNAEQATRALQAANGELEAFSYSVSHDLRAPLRGISGFAEALMEDCAPHLPDEGRRYLSLIQENAHKMGRLIDDLLAFSRLGRQPVTRTEFDIGRLAQSVFDELIGPARDRNIVFSLQSVPLANGDRTLVRQVLVNLLSNSVKFTRTRAQASIEFGYSQDQQAYLVRDNGVGFDMRYADKLFGVFQRLHDVVEFEGTGVGLALVARIITRHGGRIWAESQVDEGASFYFSLGG